MIDFLCLCRATKTPSMKIDNMIGDKFCNYDEF